MCHRQFLVFMLLCILLPLAPSFHSLANAEQYEDEEYDEEYEDYTYEDDYLEELDASGSGEPDYDYSYSYQVR